MATVILNVTIQKGVYSSWDDDIRREVLVQAEYDALRGLPWEAICAGFVQPALLDSTMEPEPQPQEAKDAS